MRISDAVLLSRRAVMIGAIAMAALAANLPGPVSASPTDRAQSLVQNLARDLTAIIATNRPAEQMFPEFRQLLQRYGDMPTVARAVLGPPWRTASPQQQQAFVDAFQGYVSRKYGRQFNELQGAELQVTRVRDAGQQGVLVDTAVRRPGRSDFVVSFQVSEGSGQPRLVNIVFEGVSMLATERAEIAARLEAGRGDLDRLIETLRQAG